MHTYEEEEYNNREEEERFYRNILRLKESYRESIEFPDIVRELDDRSLGVEKRVMEDKIYRERIRKNINCAGTIALSGFLGSGLLFYGVRKECEMPIVFGAGLIGYVLLRAIKKMR